MYLIKTVLIVWGFLGTINALFDKFNVWDMLAKEGSLSNSTIFYKLTQCQFCINFWITVLITIATICFNPFNWVVLNVPFIVIGITHLTTKR